MDAVTYPSTDVMALFRRELVPLRLPHDHKPLADELRVVRTPCLVLLGAGGREHHRSTGFLSSENLLATVQLGLAKVLRDLQSFDEAIERLDRLLNDYPLSDAVPEAVYVRGRTLYKSRHDRAFLKETYVQLASRFPKSEWTRRAFQYRLL